MTNREKEILDMISKNPFISQQEIAKSLGITRSSVAVHITNLMKKGYIKGKGYILKDRPYVTVIGGANIDIQGFPYGKLNLNDSNPGKVKISLGGVGRNIAENLVKMDIDTKLVTVIGDDPYGKKILEECKMAKIDMDDSLVIKNRFSSVYLSILDEEGDMKSAISDMDIINEIDIDFIKKKAMIIRNSKTVVVDTNIRKKVLEYLLTNFPEIDFFLDTVSSVKALKAKDIVFKCHTIKPNKIEAEALTGIKIDSEKAIEKTIKYFTDRGIRRVFISLGKNGVYYGNKEKIGYISSPKIKVINATGAGDAFMAGLIYSHLNNYSIDESCRFAMAASILALSHENTINPNMSIEKVEEKMKEMIKC
ncbi:MAG: pseudouridine kinase [Candidatus Petromonas sp.]|jgi:pseudouridine kinase|nr:pseudouridine kinase [Candidatus Petromonas sp.]